MQFSVILLLSLAILCNSQTATTSKSVCIYDFAAVNYESDQVDILESEDCYHQVPDYKKVIVAHNRETLCYVNRKYLYLNKTNSRLNRCGEYMVMVGPSQRPIVCMVAGFMNLKVNNTLMTPELTERFFGVTSKTISQLTGGLEGSTNYFTQVTFSPSDIDQGVNPSLFVLSTDNNTAKVQVGNSNQIIEQVTVVTKGKEKIYGQNIDGTFSFKIEDGISELRLISFDYNKLIIKNPNLTMPTTIGLASRFKAVRPKNCKFVIDDKIWKEGEVSNSTFMRWQVWQVNRNGEGAMYDFTNEQMKLTSNEIIDGKGFLSVGFFYPTEMLISQDFKELVVEFEVENTDNYEFARTILVRNREYGKINIETMEYIDTNLTTKFYLTGDKKTIHLRAAFKNTDYSFTNLFAFSGFVPIGSYIILRSAYLTRSDANDNQYHCDHLSWDCDNMECRITNTSVVDGTNHWSEFCKPNCGTCRDGFVCTTGGRCISEINENIRSGQLATVCLFVCLLLISLF
ncbi:hypothetical protein EIN_476000 [Entamoeba invadens IP1]|uniref:ShKT domain-containing protein n=1 Tax=Entamoeba invadens IP1 TaxID=370355 RepID=A0A0A1U3V2_ENTIV|nr:hypothetical protein EIN_476000 [Entamoeba invadens IP1]ELP88898.1 hypothetical protein EIN_476000 [Entamoeba invadens IP1]|eukprot:XP_004255669.1 hypothetical protein EIN_476000 [Entamoeba invadens IP1]